MKLRMKDIVKKASEATKIPVEVIIGPSRKKKLAQIRHAIYFVCREQGYSFPRIGAAVGGRDHTTIIHGVKQAAILIERNKDFGDLIRVLRQAEPEFKYVGKLIEAEVPLKYKSSIPRDGTFGTDTDAIIREEGTMRLTRALMAAGVIKADHSLQSPK